MALGFSVDKSKQEGNHYCNSQIKHSVIHKHSLYFEILDHHFKNNLFDHIPFTLFYIKIC